ncbi:uncharacterized protein TNCV_3433351 [Trichonephila clavipes]|nr:uncharacterized protein TNCV_3433351 [Trichonephila clavipes]
MLGLVVPRRALNAVKTRRVELAVVSWPLPKNYSSRSYESSLDGAASECSYNSRGALTILTLKLLPHDSGSPVLVTWTTLIGKQIEQFEWWKRRKTRESLVPSENPAASPRYKARADKASLSIKKTVDEKEKEVWNSFREVVEKFLGSAKDCNYRNIIERTSKVFQIQGCNTSLKVHFLLSHVKYFLENLGNVSEEQGERFHKKYQGDGAYVSE